MENVKVNHTVVLANDVSEAVAKLIQKHENITYIQIKNINDNNIPQQIEPIPGNYKQFNISY